MLDHGVQYRDVRRYSASEESYLVSTFTSFWMRGSCCYYGFCTILIHLVSITMSRDTLVSLSDPVSSIGLERWQTRYLYVKDWLWCCHPDWETHSMLLLGIMVWLRLATIMRRYCHLQAPTLGSRWMSKRNIGTETDHLLLQRSGNPWSQQVNWNKIQSSK